MHALARRKRLSLSQNERDKSYQKLLGISGIGNELRTLIFERLQHLVNIALPVICEESTECIQPDFSHWRRGITVIELCHVIRRLNQLDAFLLSVVDL